MNLYDESNIAAAPWPETGAGRQARDFLVPLFQQGAGAYFSERTTFRLLELDGLLLPLSINGGEYGNSGLFSPYARYVGHQLAALASNEAFKPAQRFVVRQVIQGLGGVLKAAQLNKCIYVDNWPTLRNTTPLLTAEQVRRLTRFLVERFPRHAIVFPMLSPATHSPLLNTLGECGYGFAYGPYTRMLLPHGVELSRKVVLNRRRDARLLEESGYKRVDGRDMSGCAPRLAELYRMLNREKYKTNPEVSTAYFEAALRGGPQHVRLLVKDGRIDVFYTFTVHGDVVHSPVAGYDLGIPQEVGLYRILNSLLMREALERGLAIETGAGADEFKSLRGDLPVPRYNAVHCAHLSARRQAGWRLVQRFANGPLLSAARAHLRRIDGGAVAGFDAMPRTFASPILSPRESVELLRKELDAVDAELDAASSWQRRDTADRLTGLKRKLEDWPFPPPRVSELRAKLTRVEEHLHQEKRHRKVSARAHRAELARALVGNAVKVGGVTLVLGHVGEASESHLRTLVELVRKAAASSAVVLAGVEGGDVLLVTAAAPELFPRGVDAGQLLAQVVPEVEGRGEGGPELAWGKGTRPEGVDAALEAARKYLRSRLED